MDQINNSPGTDMKMIERKSGIPILAFGGVWLGYALVFPLYKPMHFIVAGALGLASFLLLNKAIPAKVEYVPVQQTAAPTGDPAADQLLSEGRKLLADIRARRQSIKNQDVTRKVESVEATVQRIFGFVASNPDSAGGLRKFMNYYLPTLLKLVDAYSTFEQQGVGGDNITSSMQRIEGVLDTLGTAFEKQLDALFEDTALDISTDITVVESMLVQEGLSDGQQTLKF